MSKVHLLEDELINKIAAGEVVERPASVLKELVENAIDAGATDVRVELIDGGKELISVTDNGEGMDRSDAEMCIKRHATSKISSADDLFNVATMGFRGEALASISSVSRFSIQTRQKDGPGTKLDYDDAGLRMQDWAGSFGTTISVSDLFYNVPARKSFLKASQTEYSHCLEYITSLALSLPEVGITLIHNGREQFRVGAIPYEKNDWQIGEGPFRQRVTDVLSKKYDGEFLYTKIEDKFGYVEALVSPPGHEKGSSKFLYTYVNGRWVKDKTLRYGILRGYHSHLLKGKFPVCVLHVHIDPAIVDVNVHPAKAELRFQYASELQNIIAQAIRQKLRDSSWAESPRETPSMPSFSSSSSSPSSSFNSSFDLSSSAQTSSSSAASSSRMSFDGPSSYRAPSSPRPSTFAAPSSPKMSDSERFASSFSSSGPQETVKTEEYNPAIMTSFEGNTVKFNDQNEAIPWSELRFMGVYSKCYLFFEHGERMLVIDQHAFHERVLYERLKNDHDQLCRTQSCLVPELLYFSASEVSHLESRKEEIQEYGFDWNVIDSTSIEVTSVPSLLVGKDIEAFFSELAKSNKEGMQLGATQEIMHDVLSSMACHAAVRSGEELPDAELDYLIKEAETVDFYHNCPHGRRIFKWWKKSQIESWFDR